MRRTTTASLVVLATALNGAIGATMSTVPTQTTTVESCAVVSGISASYYSEYPTATAFPLTPSVALECLASIPVDVGRDIALINYILPYIQQFSTLAYLKNPPQGYLVPGIDILGALDEMKTMLSKGAYLTQYDFAVDLYNIFIRARDGHFAYKPALLDVFSLQPPFQILSLSEDGVSLPKIYIAEDVLNGRDNQNYTYSSITAIDDVDIVEILEKGATMSSQDPDAIYNGLFAPSLPLTNAGLVGDGLFYSGFHATLPDSIKVTFSNGTTAVIEMMATSSLDFTGIDTGGKLHSAVEIPPTPTTTASASAAASSSAAPSMTSTAANAEPTVPGYPYPVIKHSLDYISGYFLNGTGYEDNAVLSLYAFEPMETTAFNSTDAELEFRDVVYTFLSECKKTGKTKLVIDLQGNGGGLVESGYELFVQLFPTADVVDFSAQRATDLLDFLGYVDGFDPEGPIGPVLDSEKEGFDDWDTFYGPRGIYNDNFTSMFQYNFSNSADLGYVLSGYDGIPDPSSPFTPDNIVIITDGVCASTCTLFTGLATRRAGVRTIAFGGRPIEQPMQAIGGTKGSQVQKWITILGQTYYAAQALNGSIPAKYNQTGGLPDLNDDMPLMPSLEDSGASLNYRNAYLNASDEIPAQFIYEAANCKRFYTFETLFNITKAWETAADIAWKGAKCVAGSTANSDDTISNDALPWTVAVVAPNMAIDGPGSVPTTNLEPSSSSSGDSTKQTSTAKSEFLSTGAVAGGAAAAIGVSAVVAAGILWKRRRNSKGAYKDANAAKDLEMREESALEPGEHEQRPFIPESEWQQRGE